MVPAEETPDWGSECFARGGGGASEPFALQREPQNDEAEGHRPGSAQKGLTL